MAIYNIEQKVRKIRRYQVDHEVLFYGDYFILGHIDGKL